MQALLELDCIPAGMELFPAANEDQWTLIKKVIDDCDYYIVIGAGRYGSIGPSGQSYTEMEYRYALEQGKPAIGFLHKDLGSLPSSRCEQTQEAQAKLEVFRNLVKAKMCRFWDSPAELGSQVSRSLIKLIKNEPATGWVKANLVPDQSAAEEILRLNRTIDELKDELERARTIAPPGSDKLAHGDDELIIWFDFFSGDQFGFENTRHEDKLFFMWDDIFSAVSPSMIVEASDDEFRNALNRLIEQEAMPVLRDAKEFQSSRLTNFAIRQEFFNMIKVQLRALGLIKTSEKVRSVKDTMAYWTLTPYGDTVMTRLLALPRPAPDTSAAQANGKRK